MQPTEELRVFFLGAGSVSEALIKGLVQARLFPAEQIRSVIVKMLCAWRPCTGVMG